MADQSFDPNHFFAEMRPRLHRHCARMVGSSFDGEDVVQDALARAAIAIREQVDAIERPESWLFRIAHNAALDMLRRRKREFVDEIDIDSANIADPAAAADAHVAAAASLAAFLHLPPGQRASVVLSDIIGHSAEETSHILGMSTSAVKAALHRGRAQLKALAAATEMPPIAEADRARLRAYADTFNARDFDALRALLAEDVRLDLVARVKLDGKKDVSIYFTRYSDSSGWRFAPGLADGRLALFVSNPAVAANPIAYVVLLDWSGERIAAIRDFRFAAYIMDGLAVSPL